MELADRAGAALDNARLYVREREGALMLQRSLLPRAAPAPPGVDVAYRYVPGSSGAEVGGDWFDVIPLAGGRVALVVGDVMGHGLRAAATMGRLRTAVRTLAGLDMPPARTAAPRQRAGRRPRAEPGRGLDGHRRLRRLRPRRPAAAPSPRPGTCRRCWSSRATAAAGRSRGCSTCRRACRSASAACRFETIELDVPDGTVLCSTPTAWSSPAARTSAPAWNGSRTTLSPPAGLAGGRLRRLAGHHGARAASPTTWRC